jgi:acyl-CoA thioesterase I
METKTNKRMAHTAILQLFAAILYLSLWACSSEPKLRHLAPDALILAFGDSLTYGTGAAPTENYPAVLEKLIGRHVINAGVPGETTAEGAARLQLLLEQEKPSLLILCHGGNDLLRHFDQKETKRNLGTMVQLAKGRQIAVVLIAVPAPGIFLKPPAFYEDLADEQGILLDKESLKTILSDGTRKSDYIHPNADGYRMLAESIRALLKKNGALD